MRVDVGQVTARWLGPSSRHREVMRSGLTLAALLAGLAVSGLANHAWASTGAGVLVATGEMAFPRAAHSATLLLDGRVLVAGGCTVDSCNLTADGKTTEFFDPATNIFAPGPDMSEPRVGQTAVSLDDGRVLLVGGWGRSEALASAELYDPATNAFARIPLAGGPRADATGATLPDGRVLVAGGYDGEQALATAEIFDPRTDMFAPAPAMSVPRTAHIGIPLEDGRVLIAGGADAEGRILASAELYDPVSGDFTATGSMAQARYKHGAVRLGDGRVLIVGGSDERDYGGRFSTLEVYDPATGHFTSAGTMVAPRFKIPSAVVALADGSALIAGGAPYPERFEPAAGLSTLAASVDDSWAFATAVLLPDGDVLIAGGYDPRIELTDNAWRYHS